MLEVLSIIRFAKNTFAPVNRIPSEVLSLIPDYLEIQDAELIMLTHVCRIWREIFKSRSSLWVSLHCRDVEKTRVYIQRSKSSPLKVSLTTSNYHSNALLLVVPHINRLSSLSAWGSADIVPDLIRNFSDPAPLLQGLKIGPLSDNTHTPTLFATLFNGDISSLRELFIAGVTHLPWRNMSNLKVLELYHDPGIADTLFVTQLLDFIENAPLLSDTTLYSIPASSNIPSRGVVPIPHLKKLTLYSPSEGSTFLRYLSIPTGASLVIDFLRRGGSPSIPGCLPQNFDNLNNLSDIHQPLVESPATNHKPGKRGITGHHPYNNQLEIITRYNLISVYVTFAIMLTPAKLLPDYYMSPENIFPWYRFGSLQRSIWTYDFRNPDKGVQGVRSHGSGYIVVYAFTDIGPDCMRL